MESWTSLGMEMGRVWWRAIASPLFIALYAGIFLLTGWSYSRRSPRAERRKTACQAFLSVLTGLCGGFLGSALLLVAGIDVRNIGILPLWLISLLLALIHPRLICFSYAGGLLSLYYQMTAPPAACVPQIIGLIAILHLIESFLILVDGSTQPGRVNIAREGQTVPGFRLQRFWPLLLVMACTADPGFGKTMPVGWPLLKCLPTDQCGSSYVLLPVLAILGYGETAACATPRLTVLRSAHNLGLYSLILLALALGAAAFPWLNWLAAIFAPLGHEAVIWLGRRAQSRSA